MAILKYTDTNGITHIVNSYKINNVIVAQEKGESTADVMSQKAVTDEIKKVNSLIPTKVSQLTNDENYLTQHQSLADYAKTVDVDTKLGKKANSADVYKKTEIDTKVTNINSSITSETNRATTAENKIKTDLTSELNKKVATVTIEKDSTNDLQYHLLVNGENSGDINIPKDQFLSNVVYSSATKVITFTFETTTGTTTTDVNISDLIDTYTAGNGLSLTDGKFSVKKSDGSQPYLEVTADGVKVVGVDEALALKANAANVYTKDEIEAKGYLTEHQDISSFVTKDELAEVKIKTDANTSAVTDEVTRAKDAESNLNVAIKANETSITNEVTRATNAEKVISDKLDEHLADVKEYKKSVDTAIDGLRGADTAINEKIATNLSDTKASIESVKTDYKASDVTLQSNIDKEVVRATTEEGKINSALTDEVARAKAKETELSDMVNSLDSDYKAADTQLKSTIDGLTTDLTNEVNRATEAENKIESDLTVEINKKVASVTIEKNSTSDLQYTLYVDGKPSGEVNIPKDQFLTNVEYLAGEKIIRFTFETTSGVKVTDVNVADLVDTYIAGDGLTLVDNKFSVKKSDGSQPYIEVTADGVKVVGIDEALALKADKTDVTASLANKVDNTTYAADKSNINNAINTVSDNLTAETSRATGVEDGIKAEVAKKANTTDVNTSLDKKLDKTTYTTDKATYALKSDVATELGKKANTTDVTTELAKKANSSDVYTRDEIDTLTATMDGGEF